ncbi:MAG: aldo/keto reductase, partial [Rhodocyclaceae bacterium]|nr:aldo/keto reductase [Rhodocyclaceae bacterium]
GIVGRFTSFANFGQRYDKPGVAAAVAAYCSLAREHGLTPTQLALAFMRSRWCVASTIVGASTLTQLAEDLDACEVKLSEEALTAIDGLYLMHGNVAP